jgi:hypothetical protein
VVQRGRARRGGGGADWVGDRDDIFHGFWGLARDEPGRAGIFSLFLLSIDSGGVKRQDCDLWRAVEPEGQADGADAAVDVELHLVEAVVAFRVLHAHRG